MARLHAPRRGFVGLATAARLRAASDSTRAERAIVPGAALARAALVEAGPYGAERRCEREIVAVQRRTAVTRNYLERHTSWLERESCSNAVDFHGKFRDIRLTVNETPRNFLLSVSVKIHLVGCECRERG